jgi:hypothetical protein
MAIAIDASSPTATKGNGSTGFYTATFSPPADSLIVAIATAGGSNFTNVSVTSLTDSAGNTYMQLGQKNSTASCSEVWSTYIASAQTDVSVSVSFVGSFNNAKSATLTVVVLTGASSVQPGTLVTNTTKTVSLTPQSLDSMIFGAISSGGSASAYSTDANTSLLLNSNGVTSGFSKFSSLTFCSTNPTTSLTATTYGASNSLASQNICAVEILPAAPPNTAPTAAISASQTTGVQAGAELTLTLTDSDSDGTIASRTLRQIGGPTVTLNGTPGNGATITFTAPPTNSGDTLVFGYKVTDDDGAESTEATVTISVDPATARMMIDGVEVPVYMYVYHPDG